MSRPVLVADANLARVEELFSPHAELRLLPGRSIRREHLLDAEGLLVRSVTRVDRELLSGTPVRFVGSATIGADHLDRDHLGRSGIHWATAPGCNARAVVDYVCSAIAALPDLLERLLGGERVGIVGGGNVGRRLAQRLRAAGIEVGVVDPWLQPPQPWPLMGLQDLERCALVCLHTPLVVAGWHPTYHLFDEERLDRLAPGTVLLNAGRGAVVDQQALAERLGADRLTAVLDVWEHEPQVPPQLLDGVALGTPHVAGYSDDGKLAGSLAIWAAWCQWREVSPGPAPSLPTAPPLELDAGLEQAELVRAACLAAYDIRRDDEALRQVVAAGEPGGFDRLRRDYPSRREYGTRALPAGLTSAQRGLLEAWGLGVDNDR